MALIKCAECGKDISDKAAACVHCGCPIAFSASKPEPADPKNSANDACDNGSTANSDPLDFIKQFINTANQNIPTVTIEATLTGPQTASTAVSVFVPEFNRSVRVNIPNSITEGQSLIVSAEINSALNGINSPLKVHIAKVARMEAHSKTAAAHSGSDIEQKIKTLKRRIYVKPIASMIFSVYFVLSFAGLFLMMYLFPDGGAPEILMNIIGIGFSVGFLPVFYFKFLPYIIKRYPDPGFFKTLKIMKHLEKRNLLEKAVTEMETCELVPFGDAMCLTDSFLLSKKKNGIIIPCDELLWVYDSYSNRYGTGYLMLGTEKWGIQCFSRIRSRKQYSQIAAATIQALQKRNPSILVGNTRENKKKYFQFIRN